MCSSQVSAKEFLYTYYKSQRWNCNALGTTQLPPISSYYWPKMSTLEIRFSHTYLHLTKFCSQEILAEKSFSTEFIILETKLAVWAKKTLFSFACVFYYQERIRTKTLSHLHTGLFINYVRVFFGLSWPCTYPRK